LITAHDELLAENLELRKQNEALQTQARCNVLQRDQLWLRSSSVTRGGGHEKPISKKTATQLGNFLSDPWGVISVQFLT